MNERKAYFCSHPDHGEKMSHYRLFLLPGDPEPPTCDKHPSRKMERQKNKPYNARLDGRKPT